ncbi:MAG: hypothetical protein WA639_14860 [Candidatus Acidiferrum sp.]
MKTLHFAAMTLAVATLGIPVLARGQTQETFQEEKKPELINIKGTVRADGDRITFVADEGGKAWDVVNPDSLKEHLGHHVELRARLYKDKDQIDVVKVSMI